MNPHRRLLTLLAAALVAIAIQCGLSAGAAVAAPLWNLDIHHDQTNFPPGGTAELSFDVRNLGDSPSSGATTLHVDLPAGITRDSYRLDPGTLQGTETAWECPGAPGDTSFTCTTTDALDPRGVARSDVRNLILTVAVAPNAGPDLRVTAALSGGGAPDAPPAAGCLPGVGACASEAIHVSPDLAPFGIVEGSWIADFYASDEVTPVHEAGSHPDLATFSFDLNTIEGGLTQAKDPQKIPAGGLRDVQVDLPPGFLGDPTAVGECAPDQLTGQTCPLSSVVGRADATIQAGSGATSRFDLSAPIFNLSHPRGSITQLGFVFAEKTIHIDVSLDPANNYSVRAVTPGINETDRPMNTRVTLWGVRATRATMPSAVTKVVRRGSR